MVKERYFKEPRVEVTHIIKGENWKRHTSKSVHSGSKKQLKVSIVELTLYKMCA